MAKKRRSTNAKDTSRKAKSTSKHPPSFDSLVGHIHQGDCVAGMQQIPDGVVDLVFADPPFNIGYDYDEYEDRLEADQYVQWCSDWMRQVHRILKSDGAFWLAIGDDYAAELKIAAQKLGFHTRNWIIWYYTFGVHCKSKFTRSHTHLFYFIKDEKNFTFNFDEVAVPSARQLVYNDRRANKKGRSPDDTWILRPQDCDGFEENEDTWYFPRVAGTFKERAGFHGCQMPEQLLGRIIRACSHPQELVVDPFSGSSTTLAVAKKLDRKFCGFELSKEYVKLGTERLKSAQVGQPLNGAKDPKRSVPTTKQAKKQKRVREKNSNKQAKPAAKAVAQLEINFDELLGSDKTTSKTKPKARKKASKKSTAKKTSESRPSTVKTKRKTTKSRTTKRKKAP